MSDESNRGGSWVPKVDASFADHEGQAAEREPAYTRPATPLRETPIFKRMIEGIPPSEKEILNDADHGIAAAANGNAMKRSEARRDAVLAVALAIKRRGGNPLTDWTVKDTDTAYSIADMLASLT